MNGVPYVRLKGRDPSLPDDALEGVGADVTGIDFTSGVTVTLPHHVDIVGGQGPVPGQQQLWCVHLPGPAGRNGLYPTSYGKGELFRLYNGQTQSSG